MVQDARRLLGTVLGDGGEAKQLQNHRESSGTRIAQRTKRRETRKKHTSISPTSSVGCRSNLCSPQILGPAGKAGSPRTSLSNPAYILPHAYQCPTRKPCGIGRYLWRASANQVTDSVLRACRKHIHWLQKALTLQDAISSPYLSALPTHRCPSSTSADHQ